jgi:pimeloyl-ACP methyl ester carboxylesterase
MASRRKKVFLGIVGLVAGWYLLNYSLTDAPAACALDNLSAVVGDDTTLEVVKAKWFPVQHCLVKGYVTTTNPGPNRVNFRLQLPAKKDWNGRYYFIGLGGAAGRTPILSESPFGNPIVAGFAAAGTDTGHQPFMLNMLDWSFLTNEAQTLDHIHRGAHVSAVATQAITRAYYDTDKIYRYHSGCSGGGRMGVMAALHHPEDYDGLLIGAPGIDSTNIINFMWIAQHIDKLPAKKFEKPKILALEASIQAQCDASDGVIDEMVWDPRKCDYDPSHLLCEQGQDETACFTPAELEVIKAIMAGPRSPAGQIYPGLTAANPSGWLLFFDLGAETIATSFSQTYFGPDFNFMTDFDFNDQGDLDAWWAAVEKTGFGIRPSPDYSAVEEAGARVIFWHGVSDPAISVQDQINYYEEIRAATADDEKLNQFARMYLAPGLYHCFGGPGPVDVPDRLLETLIEWVEKDSPPGPVITQRGQKKLTFESSGIFRYMPNPYDYIDTPPKGTPPRDFLLCPYPQEAVFVGDQPSAQAKYDAANWQCHFPAGTIGGG